MRIKRMNSDFGNSVVASMINGEKEVIEIPTTVTKITKSEAEDYFPSKIEPNELKDHLIIELDGTYYLVGSAALRKAGNDMHVGTLHNKIESDIPFVLFLSSVAVYEAMENDEPLEDGAVDVEVDYFSTLLPIFELLESDKFSEKLNEMANRYKNDFSFRVITTGCEKTINLKVKESKCYAESLVARFALLYQFDLNPNPAAKKFEDHQCINCDLGGLTNDLVLLTPGLGNPKKRDDFKTVTNIQYLGLLKELVEGKLRRYFDSTKELDAFIVENYKNNKYLWVDGKTGEQSDLTEIIEEALRNFTNRLLELITNAFPRPETGKFYKYNYFGGIAPILREYIKEYVENKYGPEMFEEYHHIEPDTSARMLNLYGLEIISRQNTIASKQ